MTNYTGQTAQQVYDSVENRFFYGLRRTDSGELFLAKVDLLKNDDSITINKPGNVEDNYTNFQEGQDFFEGRNVKHKIIYANLNYEQYRWDNKNLYYYVNNNGELVVRTSGSYAYDDTISSTGLEN